MEKIKLFISLLFLINIIYTIDPSEKELLNNANSILPLISANENNLFIITGSYSKNENDKYPLLIYNISEYNNSYKKNFEI